MINLWQCWKRELALEIPAESQNAVFLSAHSGCGPSTRLVTWGERAAPHHTENINPKLQSLWNVLSVALLASVPADETL
ncbi:hypothetical protein CapIbe_019819 [Capra ibex]